MNTFVLPISAQSNVLGTLRAQPGRSQDLEAVDE